MRRHVVDDGEERRRAVGEPAEGVAAPPGHGLRDVLVVDHVAVEEAGPPIGVDPPHLGVPDGPAGRLVPGALALVAVEELAVVRRPVARRLQPPADGVVRVAQPLGTAPGAGVVPHPVVLAVLPADQLGPRRAAHRVRRDRVAEAHAPGDQQPPRLREVAQLVGTHIVGEDEDDVPPTRAGAVGRRRGAGIVGDGERAGQRRHEHEHPRDCSPGPPHALKLADTPSSAGRWAEVTATLQCRAHQAPCDPRRWLRPSSQPRIIR